MGCAHQCGSRLKEARSVTKWQILLRFNGGAALTSVKSFLGFRVIFFISSFFNWSSLPQMNGMPYRRRPSQSGWTSTWKRWEILKSVNFDEGTAFPRVFHYKWGEVKCGFKSTPWHKELQSELTNSDMPNRDWFPCQFEVQGTIAHFHLFMEPSVIGGRPRRLSFRIVN